MILIVGIRRDYPAINRRDFGRLDALHLSYRYQDSSIPYRLEGRHWDAIGTPLGRHWDAIGTSLGRHWGRPRNGQPL